MMVPLKSQILCSIGLSFFFFKFLIILIKKKKREREREGEPEREGGRVSQADSAEPDTGLKLENCEIMT